MRERIQWKMVKDNLSKIIIQHSRYSLLTQFKYNAAVLLQETPSLHTTLGWKRGVLSKF